MKRKRIDNAPLPSNEEYNTEDCNEPCGSSFVALSEEVMVERAVEDKERRQTQVHCQDLEKKLKEVSNEKGTLQKVYEELKSRMLLSAEVLMDNDKKVTDLPSYSVLKTIFDLFSIDLPARVFDAKLDTFDQLMLVLIKLRLNLGDQDLAYRFGISQSTVSRYFTKIVDILYTKLSCLIYWPERSELLKTMPMEFCKYFKRCIVIINCFEIFIERLTSLAATAQTWLNYKHHNTVK